MESRRVKARNKHMKFVLAALATGLVISISFILGYTLATLKVPALVNSLNQDQQVLQALSLTASIGNANSTLACSILQAGMTSLNNQLNILNSEIDSTGSGYPLPSGYGSIVDQFAFIRTNYWLLSQRLYSQCGHKDINILMFYPQTGCQSCVIEGEELSYIGQESNYTLIATVLNANANVSSVAVLDRLYNVTVYPTVVLNGKHVFVGYMTTNSIISYICGYYPGFDLCSSNSSA